MPAQPASPWIPIISRCWVTAIASASSTVMQYQKLVSTRKTGGWNERSVLALRKKRNTRKKKTTMIQPCLVQLIDWLVHCGHFATLHRLIAWLTKVAHLFIRHFKFSGQRSRQADTECTLSHSAFPREYQDFMLDRQHTYPDLIHGWKWQVVKEDCEKRNTHNWSPNVLVPTRVGLLWLWWCANDLVRTASTGRRLSRLVASRSRTICKCTSYDKYSYQFHTKATQSINQSTHSSISKSIKYCNTSVSCKLTFRRVLRNIRHYFSGKTPRNELWECWTASWKRLWL